MRMKFKSEYLYPETHVILYTLNFDERPVTRGLKGKHPSAQLRLAFNPKPNLKKGNQHNRWP